MNKYVRVSEIDEVPEGLVVKQIPRANYAVFTVPGPFSTSLIETWHKIWNSNLKRAYKSDLEIYRASFDPQKNPEVKICIGLKS